MLSEQEMIRLANVEGPKIAQKTSLQNILNRNAVSALKDLEVQSGKVRDSIVISAEQTDLEYNVRVMVGTDRISTGDEHRGNIPFKNQVLAAMHTHWYHMLKGTVGGSQIHISGLRVTSPVVACEELKMFPIEFVVRSYMAKSNSSTSLYPAWRSAAANDKKHFEYAGHDFTVADLQPNGKLPKTILTPSTKAKHDVTVSREYLIKKGVITTDQYNQITRASLAAEETANDFLYDRHLLMPDFKFEFGVDHEGNIQVADEYLTTDSARYWELNSDGSIKLKNGEPIQVSKEVGRQLMTMPGQQFTSEQEVQLSVLFMSGYQQITGKEFKPDLRPYETRVIEDLNRAVKTLSLD